MATRKATTSDKKPAKKAGAIPVRAVSSLPRGLTMPNQKARKNLKEKEDDFGDVILLNKICEGSWLTGEENSDNIAGKTIDFIKADNEELYVFLVPHGDCPKDVEVQVTDKKTTPLTWSPSKKPLYAKYLLLTGPAHAIKDEGETNKDKKGRKRAIGSQFFIHYVVKLAEKMHGFSKTKSPRSGRDNHDSLERALSELGATYGGETLGSIHGREKDCDLALLVTFRAAAIYKPEKPVPVSISTPIEMESETGTGYNFQRGRGLVYREEKKGGKKVDYATAYGQLCKAIKEIKQPHNCITDTLQTVGDLIDSYKSQKNTVTLLDLAGAKYDEQIYTNLLYRILRENEMLTKFLGFLCDKGIRSAGAFAAKEKYMISRERKIVGGRMDVCAQSESQRIVIENKVLSGLNGRNIEDSKTQLNEYYDWAKGEDGGFTPSMEPICLIAVPDYRQKEIEAEIMLHDEPLEEEQQMSTKWAFVPYSTISQFVAKYQSHLEAAGFTKHHIEEIQNAFNSLSLSKEQLYTGKFLEAVKRLRETDRTNTSTPTRTP